MLINILKTTLRNFLKNRTQSTVNILGLSLGLFTVFVTMIWVEYHFSFDSMHSKYDTIHVLKANFQNENGSLDTYSGAPFKLMTEATMSLPQIKNMTRVYSNWRWPALQCFKIDETDECAYRQGIYSDSSFFEVFDYPIIHGAANPLLNPSEVINGHS